jgi:hypothetical protein
MERGSVSETLRFIFFRMSDVGQSPKSSGSERISLSDTTKIWEVSDCELLTHYIAWNNTMLNEYLIITDLGGSARDLHLSWNLSGGNCHTVGLSQSVHVAKSPLRHCSEALQLKSRFRCIAKLQLRVRYTNRYTWLGERASFGIKTRSYPKPFGKLVAG